MSESSKNKFSQDVAQIGRGILMGGADIIPGVSGGTVALILGIYERLVAAISHFDLTLLGLLKQRNWIKAAEHVDLRFLVTLFLGIVTGIVSLASIMHYLITDPGAQPFTLAAFFGLIMASGVLVGKLIERWNIATAALILLGTIVAYSIIGAGTVDKAAQDIPFEPSLGYIFFTGMIAICAMILPGISGAFIMLLLGVYEHITGAIKGLPKGDFSSENILTVIFFCLGCGIGLLCFSKFLRWLLAKHHSATMAVLCGFMLGSLRKLWPWPSSAEEPIPGTTLGSWFPESLRESLPEIWVPNELIVPGQISGHVAGCVGVALVAAASVFVLERVSQSSNKETAA